MLLCGKQATSFLLIIVVLRSMKEVISKHMPPGALESAVRAAEAAGIDVVIYSEFPEMRERLDSRGLQQVHCTNKRFFY